MDRQQFCSLYWLKHIINRKENLESKFWMVNLQYNEICLMFFYFPQEALKKQFSDERRSKLSIDLSNKKIPKEAIQALKTIAELLDNMLIGVYLYGSAVMGGLRMNSDVDILVITNQSLSEKNSKESYK